MAEDEAESDKLDIDNRYLCGSRFSGVNLSASKFHDVNLSNVAITNANLTGMTINGILVSDLLKTWEEG